MKKLVVAFVAAAIAVSSLGTRMANPGRPPTSAMSSMLIEVGPSRPVEMPAWLPSSFTFRPAIATWRRS